MPIAGRVVFVGAGQMATAMIGGFVGAGLLAPGQITAVDPRFRAGAAASDDVCPGVATSSSLGDSVPGAAIVFLCVKPDVVAGVLGDIAALPTPCDALVISIAAGVTLDAMQAIAPACRLVRVMPNTPCLVRSAASAFACGRLATRHDADLARTLMASVGTVVEVPESKLDAVTGLSGSGPAFVFMMIEALADGGVASGLTRQDAQALAAQTVLGAARMVLETSRHPGELKDAVASPAGTTIAGIVALESGGFRSSVIGAVVAASTRAKQLASQK
ncbi:Pyrroline-5-carboxylate reductase [Plasmodiophora brassicae]